MDGAQEIAGEGACGSRKLLGRPLAVIVAALLLCFSTSASAAIGQAQVELVVPAPDGVRFAGTLHKPASTRPSPVLVFVHGSERATRQQEFEFIGAQHLVDAGFAVLIVDKRGVGDTPGVYEESADIGQMAGDAIAQVEFLKHRRDIDRRYIGLFGVSRGGWAAPLAAAKSRDVAFVVMISGPGVSPNESNIYARSRELVAGGMSEDDARRLSEYNGTVWNYYGGVGTYESAQAAYERVKGATGRMLEEVGKAPYPPSALTNPAFDFFRRGTYDPEPALAGLRVPVLAAYGSQDQLIPVRKSFSILSKALLRNPRSKVVMIEGAGHGMRLQRGAGIHGTTDAQGTPEFAPDYWPTVIAWLRRVTGR